MKKRKNGGGGHSTSIRLAGKIIKLLNKLRFVKRAILGSIDCNGKGCARSRAKIGRDPIYGDIRCIWIKVSDDGAHQRIWIYIDSPMCKNLAMLKIAVMLADAGIAISFDEALKKKGGG